MRTLTAAEMKGRHKGTYKKVAKDLTGRKAVIGKDQITFDPELKKTAIGSSKITYINGKKGILRHRGYDIHPLALKGSYAQTCFLVLNGKLPQQDELDAFESSLRTHREVPKKVFGTLGGFEPEDSPMDKLNAMVTALGSRHRKTTNMKTPEGRNEFAQTFTAQMPELAAAAFRHSSGKKPLAPRAALNHAQNFYYMCFGKVPSAAVEKALDIFFTLHADHEQNASTTAAKVVISANANPYVAGAAAVGALSGSRHGGANQDVLILLEKIARGETTIDEVIARSIDPNVKELVPGLGHRVYKNKDPRADVLQSILPEILRELKSDGDNSRLFEIAQEIERRTAGIEYYQKRGVYPNVDFYSGIILKAIGFPPEMFPVLFAVGRSVGWAAQVNERVEQGLGIIRPDQDYNGEGPRPYVEIDDRSGPGPSGPSAHAGARRRHATKSSTPAPRPGTKAA